MRLGTLACGDEGGRLDQQRWAAAWYRVERDSSGVMMRKRQRKKATEQAISLGGPVPEPNEDVVRIYDRSGRVVFERDWGERRPEAMAQEAQIVDDLLKLDVVVFRGKYGIEEPEDEKALPAAPEAAGTPLSDPWADVPPPHEHRPDAEPGSAGAS